MSDGKTPIDQAVDLFVFFPIGLVLTAREELPRLIDKGRQRVTNEVQMARAVGRFAVARGQKEADRAVRHAAERLAGKAAPPTTAPRTNGAPTAPRETTGAGADGSASGAALRTAQPPAASRNGSAPPAASLAIPGYDTLSASQVVQRLAGLAPAELEAVRAYEAATRGRRTILTKVAQLQGGSAP